MVHIIAAPNHPLAFQRLDRVRIAIQRPTHHRKTARRRKHSRRPKPWLQWNTVGRGKCFRGSRSEHQRWISCEPPLPESALNSEDVAARCTWAETGCFARATQELLTTA